MASSNSDRRRPLAIPALVATVLAALVFAFSWPASRSEVSGIPIAVAGDREMVERFIQGLQRGSNLDIELHRVDSRDQIIEGIESRDYIGGISLTKEKPEVLSASAAGQAPAAIMSTITSKMQTYIDTEIYKSVSEAVRSGSMSNGDSQRAPVSHVPTALPVVAVTDVVPLSSDDSSGAGILAAGIPLTLGSILGGVVIASAIGGAANRLVAVLAFSLLGGLALVLMLSTWLNVYPGAFGELWLVLSLSLLANSSLFVGLHSLLGRHGFAIGGLITLFLGIPLAAFAIPFEFLPGYLGELGQMFIPGATATLTRCVSYFPEAPIVGGYVTLGLWALMGVIAISTGRYRQSQN